MEPQKKSKGVKSGGTADSWMGPLRPVKYPGKQASRKLRTPRDTNEALHGVERKVSFSW